MAIHYREHDLILSQTWFCLRQLHDSFAVIIHLTMTLFTKDFIEFKNRTVHFRLQMNYVSLFLSKYNYHSIYWITDLKHFFSSSINEKFHDWLLCINRLSRDTARCTVKETPPCLARRPNPGETSSRSCVCGIKSQTTGLSTLSRALFQYISINTGERRHDYGGYLRVTRDMVVFVLWTAGIRRVTVQIPVFISAWL